MTTPFRPLSRAAKTIKDILERLITGPVTVPYHKIGVRDSRLWDPEWRATYGTPYQNMLRIFTYFIGDPQQAQTVASQESYRWGRGRGPIGTLNQFSGMTPERVRDRLYVWFRAISAGNDIEGVLNAIGNGPGAAAA